jgi:hypothetical protein
MEKTSDNAEEMPWRWKPGQSGNPAGRPPDAPLVGPALRRLVKMTIEELQTYRPLTVAEVIALRQIKPLLSGDDIRRFSAIMDRIESKPTQLMEIDQPKEFILKIESDEADV